MSNAAPSSEAALLERVLRVTVQVLWLSSLPSRASCRVTPSVQPAAPVSGAPDLVVLHRTGGGAWPRLQSLYASLTLVPADDSRPLRLRLRYLDDLLDLRLASGGDDPTVLGRTRPRSSTEYLVACWVRVEEQELLADKVSHCTAVP